MSNKSIGGGLRGGISRISSVPWSPSQLKEELGEWKRAWDKHTASHTATLLAHTATLLAHCHTTCTLPHYLHTTSGTSWHSSLFARGASAGRGSEGGDANRWKEQICGHTHCICTRPHCFTHCHTVCICTYCTLHICTQPNCFTHILHIPNTLQLHHTAHNHYYTHLNDTHCITLWITHYSHCICPTCSRVSAVQGCKRWQNQQQQQINTNNNKSSSLSRRWA